MSKLEPGVNVAPLPPPSQPQISLASPAARPAASIPVSPSATTAYNSQHGTPHATADHAAVPIRQPMAAVVNIKRLRRPEMNAMAGMHAQHSTHMAGIPHALNHARATDGIQSSPLYPPASFQTHFKQLGKLTRLLSSPVSLSLALLLCRSGFIV